MMMSCQPKKTRGNDMQLKTLSFIAGAIALTLSVTPLAAQAQVNSSTPLLAQARGEKKGSWAELGLTDAQKSQLQQIRRNTRSQIEAVLTAEQKAQLQAAKQQAQQGGQRRGYKKVWQSLNLTDAQKSQIQAIKNSSRQQMDAVFTPEQKAKLQQMRHT
jgi:Spy/CpxP family protein refolding chaperone